VQETCCLKHFGKASCVGSGSIPGAPSPSTTLNIIISPHRRPHPAPPLILAPLASYLCPPSCISAMISASLLSFCHCSHPLSALPASTLLASPSLCLYYLSSQAPFHPNFGPLQTSPEPLHISKIAFLSSVSHTELDSRPHSSSNHHYASITPLWK
jgi:hypothetical protein